MVRQFFRQFSSKISSEFKNFFVHLMFASATTGSAPLSKWITNVECVKFLLEISVNIFIALKLNISDLFTVDLLHSISIRNTMAFNHFDLWPRNLINLRGTKTRNTKQHAPDLSSLTGPEHLEPPTTVPRLPACSSTRHAVTTAVGRDGATAQPVVHRRRLSQQTRSDKTPTCKASVW